MSDVGDLVCCALAGTAIASDCTRESNRGSCHAVVAAVCIVGALAMIALASYYTHLSNTYGSPYLLDKAIGLYVGGGLIGIIGAVNVCCSLSAPQPTRMYRYDRYY
jgi:hypothetical protein